MIYTIDTLAQSKRDEEKKTRRPTVRVIQAYIHTAQTTKPGPTI
jgi:hypothetical protein